MWRHTKDEIVGGGHIGDVKYVIGTLSGGRAMLFRNGTHCVDAICYYADSEPVWVSAELEEGYEDYDEYKGHGMLSVYLQAFKSWYGLLLKVENPYPLALKDIRLFR